ncbi:hypothetical protein LEP1GSC186_3674 [Leptospira noguchii serovar Autumnalis str. ZUN142]|uniref:Uncharacterized protein n=1 Tax=Leptospira noguchii serovar Autumnalis str. ZUN142 TaxID=1085540 RepID=M6U7Y3_9LEPT|nr:hypothetical protein LEP1GSC186_3674 [Leptospira noguchii serovar Autumnalis str. ZUN142]
MGDSLVLNSEFSKDGDKELYRLKRPALGLFTYCVNSKFFFEFGTQCSKFRSRF